jgi:hypothetical protein
MNATFTKRFNKTIVEITEKSSFTQIYIQSISGTIKVKGDRVDVLLNINGNRQDIDSEAVLIPAGSVFQNAVSSGVISGLTIDGSRGEFVLVAQ